MRIFKMIFYVNESDKQVSADEDLWNVLTEKDVREGKEESIILFK